MNSAWRPVGGWLLAAAAACLMVPALAWAVDGSGAESLSGQDKAVGRTVELFEAMQRGQIGVRLIPKDSSQWRLIVENKTDQPLSVKLPEAFAGVPVLAQIGNQGIGGNNALGNGAQAGGIGGGWGMGMFNIPPEKVGQLRLPGVCLEHGKKEPRPGIPYEIKPLEQVTNQPAVCELIRLLGAGKVPQRVAQAAVWNLNNDLSWQQLAAKQLHYADGTSRPYFSPLEIHAAMQAAAVATRLAEQRHGGPSSADSASAR